MKSQFENLTGQNTHRIIPLLLYLLSVTAVGILIIGNSVASEINAPNATSLLSENPPPLDLSALECSDADTIHLRLLIQNSKMRDVISRSKGVESLSAQEKNALEVIAKLITITDEGMLEIRQHNKIATDAKDKDDYACNVLRRVFQASKPLLENLKSPG